VNDEPGAASLPPDPGAGDPSRRGRPRIRSPFARIVIEISAILLIVFLASGVYAEYGLAAFGVSAAVAGVSVTLLLWLFVDRRPVVQLGFGPPRSAGEFFRGAGAAAVLVTLASLPALIVHRHDLVLLPHGAAEALRDLLVYGVALLFVSVHEETVFRGYVFRNLLLRARPWAAVITGAALFAAFHAANPAFTAAGAVNIGMAGVLLSVLTLRRGSLTWAIGFHWLWNLHQGVILSLPVSGVEIAGFIGVPAGGPDWLTGGAFGAEGSLVTTVILAAAAVSAARGAPVAWSRPPEPESAP